VRGFRVALVGNAHDEAVEASFPASDPTADAAPGSGEATAAAVTALSAAEGSGREVTLEGETFQLSHGSVVIAAITSCTNTSNPAVMVGAALLAKRAVERGLTRKPWVKSSLAPGSKVVTEYLDRAGLTRYLDALGFNLVGYGCTTCIGNSGPLPAPIVEAIADGDLVVAAVLSGNRNFEARIHSDVRANYLASPPLVVAYALAGRMDVDLTTEPLGTDGDGNDVYLRDIWPTPREIADTVEHALGRDLFERTYADVFAGDERWSALAVPQGSRYVWEPGSTYVRRPPYFDGMSRTQEGVADIAGARCLVWVGDSVTTDHISPAGSIRADSPAGRYLLDHGIAREDFNSYGSRRGNHEVMVRGTFANVRLRNLLLPGSEGAVSVHLPSHEEGSIYDVSQRYRAEGVPLIVLAGKEYGSGSSRDWAAKGPSLLGVKAVIAESYERIHRSNLLMMGIVPLQLTEDQSIASLGLTGRETFAVSGLENGEASTVAVTAAPTAGEATRFVCRVRLDTPRERDYVRHGGILRAVLRRLIAP
jgi:aconitate hydratase